MASSARARVRRCHWAQGDPLLSAYHDLEWGVPVHDDVQWFEKIVLDGAQAGLSWLTILRKRDGYRKAFRGFEPAQVARFDARDVARLLQDPGIVRNRLKIESAVGNARAFLEVQREHRSFDAYVWAHVGGATRHNRFRRPRDVPALTPAAEALSKDLKRRGFRFVGPTIVYAFMQAAGLVNDHLVTCFRHREIVTLDGSAASPGRLPRAPASRRSVVR